MKNFGEKIEKENFVRVCLVGWRERKINGKRKLSGDEFFLN